MYDLACVHLWTNGLVDGRTDGRTCNDIVLSRHDRKQILKNISESSRKSYMNMYGLACVHLYMLTNRHVDGWTHVWTGGRTHGRMDMQ